MSKFLCRIGLHSRDSYSQFGALGYSYVDPCRRCGR